MHREADLLAGIAADPSDQLAWLALADCLEENGEDDRAELVRLREWCRFADREDPLRPSREARLQALLASGVTPAGPRLVLHLGGETFLEMTLIPPGSFWMGTDGEEGGEGLTEKPRHHVTLTRGFWLGVVPFTQTQWELVMGDRPSEFVGPNRPVESITWTRSRKGCRKLGRMLGGRFRLPNESEWEYACRAGTYSRFHSGHEEPDLQRAGWYRVNSDDGTSPVGQLTPNAWGLYDMHGNVYEWCEDHFRTFTHDPVINPVGAETSSHCIRGGYWGRPYLSCRSAFRDSYSRGSRASIAGFRVARDLDGARGRRRNIPDGQ
jgi:uncharacterized protein (TIGR02996 family)